MPRNDTPSPPAPARRHAPARRLSRAPARLTPRAPLQVNANQTIAKVWAEVQVRKHAHRNASPLRRVLVWFSRGPPPSFLALAPACPPQACTALVLGVDRPTGSAARRAAYSMLTPLFFCFYSATSRTASKRAST